MGEQRHGDPGTPGTVERAGDDSGNFAIENPGLPPHRPRITDEDPRAAKRAERPGFFHVHPVHRRYHHLLRGVLWRRTAAA